MKRYRNPEADTSQVTIHTEVEEVSQRVTSTQFRPGVCQPREDTRLAPSASQTSGLLLHVSATAASVESSSLFNRAL